MCPPFMGPIDALVKMQNVELMNRKITPICWALDFHNPKPPRDAGLPTIIIIIIQL